MPALDDTARPIPRAEDDRLTLTSPLPRVLYVEGSAGLASLASKVELDVEVVREASPTRALARIEADGDFAVIVCDENVNGSEGLALLAAVRSIAPTTVRLLVSESMARAAPSETREMVFRCISPHGSPSELRGAMSDALDYHQLLATCPAQPVESRLDRIAMPPPAYRARPVVQVPSELPPAATDRVSSVLESAEAPEVILVETATTRVGLQVVGRVVELLPGLTVVGRSRSCHIPIPDPQISRRHATFSNTGRHLHLRNVSKTNGVRVNGVLVERDVPYPVKVGDRVLLGSHEIEVCALGDYCPSFEPTQTTGTAFEASEGTGRSATLVTLARVADKYFVLGQAREAERVLRPLLAGLLRHCESGQAPGPGDVELATDLVLRIAEGSRTGEWIDYLFELYTVLVRPLPSEAVERLYRIVPETQGVKMACFRAYVEALTRAAERFGPKERFLLRRIQGLETPLVISAHL